MRLPSRPPFVPATRRASARPPLFGVCPWPPASCSLVAERKRYLLRIDPRLYEVLERWARDELRSVNAQIEALLTDQARRAGRLPRQAIREGDSRSRD
jgi:hypothetical protein